MKYLNVSLGMTAITVRIVQEIIKKFVLSEIYSKTFNFKEIIVLKLRCNVKLNNKRD